MASPSDCSMGARIVFAVIGVLVGVFVCVVFGAQYHNINASAWGLVSGLVAGLTLYVHVGKLKGWWGELGGDPSPLRCYMYCGCFAQLLGVVSTAVYITLAIVEKQGVLVNGPGYIIASVWGLMTLKWGFQLFFFSRSYHRQATGGKSQDSFNIRPSQSRSLIRSSTQGMHEIMISVYSFFTRKKIFFSRSYHRQAVKTSSPSTPSRLSPGVLSEVLLRGRMRQ